MVGGLVVTGRGEELMSTEEAGQARTLADRENGNEGTDLRNMENSIRRI